MDSFEVKGTNVVTATFELPGLKSEDIAIDIQQNRLVISGDAGGHVQGESSYAVRERHLGKFSRTLQLPERLVVTNLGSIISKAEDVKAKMESGVLTVSFPKVSAEQQPRRIAIQTA